MKLSPGSFVKIKSLKKSGVLLSIDKNRARVALGDLQVTCRLSDLVESDETPSAPKDPAVTLPRYSEKQKRSLESIDLHGLTVRDALAQLEQHLNQAIMARMDKIEVVHGHGSGRIRDAVHEYLGSVSVVQRFEINQFNPGITRVYL
jgi:DNA mismatch repair protein MutS2